MNPSTNDLLAVAAIITTHSVQWYRGGPKGYWDGQRIHLRHGMSDTQTRCTLAHEIAHAVHADPPDDDPTAERRADRTAARMLITPARYAAAENIYPGDHARIAAELGVTEHLAEVWRHDHATTRQPH